MGILAGIERLCEGAFEAAPTVEVEPLDLVRAVEREIRRNRRAFINDRTYVAHGITIHFYAPTADRAEEYEALFDSEDFRAYLLEHIRQQGCQLLGRMRLAILCHRERLPQFGRRPCFVEFSWPRGDDGAEQKQHRRLEPWTAQETRLPESTAEVGKGSGAAGSTRPAPAAARPVSCVRRHPLRIAALAAAVVAALSLAETGARHGVFPRRLPAGDPAHANASPAVQSKPGGAESARPAQDERMRRLEQAGAEWERILALEKSRAGSYEDRMVALESFMRTYPDAPQSPAAAEKLSLWRKEREDYIAAEKLEAAPGARISEILAAWRRFHDGERTGLRRAHAWERVRYWTDRLENYSGYAELTIRSAHGLPPSDAGLLDSELPDAFFVLLEGGRVLYRSRTIADSADPVWNEKVRLFIAPGRVPALEVRDEDLLGYDLLVRRALAPFPADGAYRLAAGNATLELEIRREQ